MKLSRVEIITGISKIEPLKKALGKFHITGMTVYQVLGCGVQHGTQERKIRTHRGQPLVDCDVETLVVRRVRHRLNHHARFLGIPAEGKSNPGHQSIRSAAQQRPLPNQAQHLLPDSQPSGAEGRLRLAMEQCVKLARRPC